ncbi:MAG: LysR family transcriptional regulator [Lachnospiraceae bacterium]|nr:LysR family transcriptional regulator [Lachnospiraceae bacterium]
MERTETVSICTGKARHMELRHLRYFLAVCEEMNITKAAEKLMIAQPPLSRQIRDLEEEVGAPLFVREHHSLRLTEEGVRFRSYAHRIVTLADRSVEDIKEMHTGLRGTVYIAEVEGKAPRLASSYISAFSEKYPDVQYSIWNGNSDEVTQRVKNGLADVAIIMEPYDPQGLHSVPIYSEPWVAMFSSEHPLAKTKGSTIKLEMLSDHDLIIPSRGSRLQEISDWFAPLKITPKVKARISNATIAYELCEQNVGVAIYPAAAGDLIHGDRVLIKKITDPEHMASYVLIYPDNHPLSPVADKFIEFVTGSADDTGTGEDMIGK